MKSSFADSKFGYIGIIVKENTWYYQNICTSFFKNLLIKKIPYILNINLDSVNLNANIIQLTGEKLFIYFLILGKLFIYLIVRKKKVFMLSLVYIFSSLLVNNFDNIRYQTKYDNRGNEYTHDLLTGKKWKKRSNI